MTGLFTEKSIGDCNQKAPKLNQKQIPMRFRCRIFKLKGNFYKQRKPNRQDVVDITSYNDYVNVFYCILRSSDIV